MNLSAGTLIGVLRHQNIIPWDYDADIALLQDDYRRLCAVFEAAPGRRIGRLVMRPEYYGEPESCCCLLIDDNADEGIDVCAYRRDGDTLVTCMSDQMQQKWPVRYRLIHSYASGEYQSFTRLVPCAVCFFLFAGHLFVAHRRHFSASEPSLSRR